MGFGDGRLFGCSAVFYQIDWHMTRLVAIVVVHVVRVLVNMVHDRLLDRRDGAGVPSVACNALRGLELGYDAIAHCKGLGLTA